MEGVSPILQTETTTVGEVISGSTVQTLPLNGRNTAQLTLLLPGTMTYNPRGFTNIGAINSNRPFVNGNREQTNNFTVDGFDVNETIDNRIAYQPNPDAIAEISVETNNYSADTGNVGGAVVVERHQVGHEPVPRQRVRVLPEQRLRRELVGEQPVRRAEARAEAAHLRGHAGRPDRPAAPVLLRRLPALAAGRAGIRHDVGGAGGVAQGRPVERVGDDQGPADGPAVPRQPDPGGSGSAPWRRPSWATRPTTRCRTATCPAASRATTSGRRSSRSARTRATPASTGTSRTTTSSSSATRRRRTRTRAPRTRTRWC